LPQLYTHGFHNKVHNIYIYIYIYLFISQSYTYMFHNKNTAHIYLRHPHMQHFTPKHTPVHSITAHTSILFWTQYTLSFFCFMTTHPLRFSTLYTSTSHISITHSHSPTHTFQFFSILVRFHHNTHTYIIFWFCYVYTYIFTYNKTCISFLHLNIYLYILIMLFFCFRKLTDFFLDEISAALIPFSAAINRIQKSLATI